MMNGFSQDIKWEYRREIIPLTGYKHYKSVAKQIDRELVGLFPNEAETLIKRDDVNEMLLAPDMKYLDYLDEDEEPTEQGSAMVSLRDEMHWDNTHQT